MKTKRFMAAILLATALAVTSAPVMAGITATTNSSGYSSWFLQIFGPLGLLWEEGIYY